MHDYSIGKNPKETVLFILALVAVFFTPKLNSFIQELGISTGWYTATATTVSVFVWFGLVYWFFNKHLWKCAWLRKFLLVPDLDGKWLVEGMTVLKNGSKADFKWDGTITVTQSWSKILIHLQTNQSASKSVSASIHHVDGIGYTLLYQYENAPAADQLELAKHSGSVELLFDLECLSAEGHYYTDQHRNTIGTMKLRKVTNAS